MSRKKKMRKFLRKPRKTSRAEGPNWSKLYQEALGRIALNEVADTDPRVKLLRGCADNPEKVLRRLSILSRADILREFGPEPE